MLRPLRRLLRDPVFFLGLLLFFLTFGDVKPVKGQPADWKSMGELDGPPGNEVGRPQFFPPTPEMVADFHSKFIEIRLGFRIHVVDRPGRDTEAPPIVFIHGFGDSWYAWTRVLPLLGIERRVVAVDLPGCGWSSKPPAGESDPFAFYSMGSYARVLSEIFSPQHLNIQRIGCLVGHSMGSYVSWWFAGLFPSQVQNLVLIGSGTHLTPTMNPEPIPGVVQQMPGAMNVTFSDYMTQWALGGCAAMNECHPLWALQTTAYGSFQATADIKFSVMRAFYADCGLPHALANAERLAPRVTARVCQIHGTLDTVVLDPEGLQQLFPPGSELVIVPDAGHNIQVHRPRLIAEKVLELLKSEEARSSLTRSLSLFTSWSILRR